MREIKVRARHKETGEWYYGSSLITDINQGDEHSLTLSLFWLQVEKGWLDAKTVGQYTGLKDKNGKEIYEGDIVTLIDNSGKWGEEDCLTTTVKWSETGLNWNVYPCHDPKKYWRVIGNIYENPELLK